ncbi:LysR family transcriptional regulator [Acidisoma cellulosilytica]|uniref:LysR family transcriptional regulator n=1 Tax=Acidisoma cellulosilyticum TaxID=2802395 RepID=A0A964E571_9PROT|nr:LysR family transcriptional regulator [Acidisoma cellulosilyticum]MCB8882107.1 LysR family transcriptional regulator [Acidisoma cellulosilyticum]
MVKASLFELEAVTAVARTGGFRSAAQSLEMSASALSHAVASLEARLGVRLFNRTTRSVALSAAGEQFVADVAPALAAIGSAIETIGERNAEPSGTLRLNTSAGAARMLLVPLILDYIRRYPGMEVEIVTEGALVDVIGQGFDAGIRLAEAVPPDMISIPIQPLLYSAVVGAPSYFEKRNRPTVPSDLLQHTCIRARMASGRLYRWEFERRGENLLIDVPGRLTLDESSLMLEAAIAGAGLAYLSEYAVAAHVAAGRLVKVLEDWIPPYPGLCLYFAGRRHIPAKLRALIDLIRSKTDLPV